MSRLSLRSSFYGGPGFTLYHAWGENSAKRFNPHFHGEYTLGLQLRGMQEVQISNKTEGFSAGNLVLINPYQVHTGNDHESRDLEYVSIYIEPSYVASVAQDLQAQTTTPEFTVVRAQGNPRLAQQVLHLLRLVQQKSMGVGQRLARGFGTPSPTSPMNDAPTCAQNLELESTLHTLLVETFEPYSNLRCAMMRSTNRISHRKIAKAVEYLRFHAQQPRRSDGTTDEANPDLSLDSLAGVAELSKYHFLRQFAEVVGMTPGAYLRSLRLCQAARRLRESNAPILDVALSVGFADHPSFSRAFARYMGMTPSEYQRLAWL